MQGVGKYLCDSVGGCRGWGSTFVILEMGVGKYLCDFVDGCRG